MSQTNRKLIEVSSLDELHKYNIKNISVAIGVFDGVHLGHRHLLDELSSESRRNASCPVAVTFFPHPRSLIKPAQKISLILSHRHKVELLNLFGMKAVVTIAFTEEFSMLSPENFLRGFLSPKEIHLLSVFVGSGWRFGRGATGNAETLAKFAKKYGFSSKVIKELTYAGAKISSSAIRSAVTMGDLDMAKKMLGRQYGIFGIVKTGLSFASGILGFPTANLDVGDVILPPEGVYSGSAIIDGSKYAAAISIGTAQSVRNGDRHREVLVEAHILDFSKSIYGKEIEIRFDKYMREQRYFANTDRLREQISKDVDFVRKHLVL
jgi:riboflavin kinase/FMN adenylyltransferase